MPDLLAAVLLIVLAAVLVLGAALAGARPETTTARSTSTGTSVEILYSLKPHRGASRDRRLPGKARRHARRRADA